MSTAEMSSAPTPTPRKPAALWLLLTMFFAPLLIAFALYYGVPGWRPVGSTHHGDLIDPARPLPPMSVEVEQIGGATATRTDLFDGKWTLMYVGAGTCDERCRTALVDTRQVRLALNDDIQRVQRVFVPTGECCDRAYLAKEHEGLLVAKPSPENFQRLLNVIPSYDSAPPATAGRVYIVDPLGNLMMSYAAHAPSKGMLEDLKKLLKLSHIG